MYVLSRQGFDIPVWLWVIAWIGLIFRIIIKSQAD
jgi:hypothetical protein